MRDERQPFRFADFSLLPPIATSLFMAIYGVMVQVDHAVLPVLLGLHAFFMAWAAATASGRVASRVGFWVQRQAPDVALTRERRQWRRTLLWALGCGLLGPLVLASRLGDGQQWSSALWVLAETLLGAALGAWAGGQLADGRFLGRPTRVGPGTLYVGAELVCGGCFHFLC
jgi:hypothetical protein